MKFFTKRKKEIECEKKLIALQKDYDYLQQRLHVEHMKELDTTTASFKESIKFLEKEVGYWKEKALNFQKFHI